MTINVVIDGIYCKRCNDLHPTLYWHNKYDDYLLDRREKWEKDKKKRPKLYGNVEYNDPLPTYGLKQEETRGPCVICGYETFFKSLETDEYVCSNECKYALEGGKSDNE